MEMQGSQALRSACVFISRKLWQPLARAICARAWEKEGAGGIQEMSARPPAFRLLAEREKGLRNDVIAWPAASASKPTNERTNERKDEASLQGLLIRLSLRPTDRPTSGKYFISSFVAVASVAATTTLYFLSVWVIAAWRKERRLAGRPFSASERDRAFHFLSHCFLLLLLFHADFGHVCNICLSIACFRLSPVARSFVPA